MARRSSEFTTYLNVTEAKNVDKTFTDLERKAANSFKRVSEMAARASRAAQGIGTTTGGGDAARQISQIQALASADRARGRELQSTARAQREASAASERHAGRLLLESNAARAAAASTTSFERALRLSAVAANVAQGPLGPLAGRISALAVAAQSLSGVQFGAIGAGAALIGFARYADKAQELKNQLRPLYETQDQVNRAFMQARSIADNARVGLEPVISLYSRLTLAGRDAGLSQQRITRLTDIATKAARLSGGPAMSQEAGLYQFAQGIGSGTLSGDELKSVKENTLRLAKAIAEGWKNADGTIGTTIAHLKELGAQGELTPEKVAAAAERSQAKIDAEFAKLPPTISSSMTKINNAFLSMINGADEASGVTRTLAGALGFLGDNIEGVTTALGALVLLWTGNRSANIIRETQQRADAYRKERAALIESTRAQATAARDTLAATATNRRAIGERIVALRNEQAALRAKIGTEKAAADQTRRAAINIGQTAMASNTPGDARATQLYRNAMNEARVAQDNYGASTARLKSIQTELKTSTGQLVGATLSYRTATANSTTATDAAARASAGWGTAAKGLIAAIDPLGILLSVGIGLLIQWAFRQSAAADASRDLANAQNDLAKFIDATTGKIIEQNSQLVRNQVLKAKDRRTDNQKAFVEAGRVLTDATQGTRLDPTGKLGNVPSNLPPALQAAAKAFLNNPTGKSLESFQKQIDTFGKNNAKAARVIDDALTDYTQQAKGLSQTNAEIRYLSGTPRKGDLQKALGLAPEDEPNAAGTGGKKTSKQDLDVLIKQKLATSDLAKAKAEVARLESKTVRDQVIAKDGEAAYVDQVVAAKQAVVQAQAAEVQRRAGQRAGAAAAKKEARDALQDQKDLAAATRDNALIDLEKRKPELTLGEYQRQGEAILKTYDDTVNGLDASAAASDTASKAIIANIKAMAAASEKLGSKRDSIFSGIEDTPKDLKRAQLQIEQLRKMVGEVVDGIEFIGKSPDEIADARASGKTGAGVYTADQFNSDAAKRIEAVRKPINDMLKDQLEQQRIQGLRLQGYDTEANVLERMLQIQESTGAVTRTDYENALEQERVGERINEQLSRRQAIQQNILGLVDSTKGATAELLETFGTDPKKALKNFGKQIQANFLQSAARDVTDKLFAGADRKLRELINGSSGVDKAAQILADKVEKVGNTFSPLRAANDNLKSSADQAAAALTQLATAAGTAGSGGIAGLGGGSGSGAGYVADDASVIEVISAAKKIKVDGGPIQTDSIGMANTVKGFTSGLDKAFKSGTLFSDIGGGISKAFGGAATGSITGGIMKSLGLKTSATGAQIGGAIGSFLPIPGGDIIGSIAGGLIGGIFKTNRSAGATLTGVDQFSVGGKDSKNYKAATGLAGSVSDQISQIADSLGASVGSFNVTIGTRGDEYRVNTGSTSLKGKNGAVGFEDEEDAVAYAVQQIISQGAITGISKASQTILKSGQDLQKAIEKATVIESIPKRLKQFTDPVGAAVDELNSEFTKMISYLQEGGATAQQFADAQKLYDLERAEAIKQATNDTVSALQDYLNEMTAGSSSPLNKRTVYANAAEDLNSYRADIASGKSVDQTAFLSAVQNLQNASRDLYGSGGQFFTDFEDLLSLVSKAKDNATTASSTGELAASPFDTSAVQSAINGQTAATETQTAQLVSKLDEVVAALKAKGYTSSAISNLPAFSQAA